MSLSCSCDYEWDGEGWCFKGSSDYVKFPGKRATKCCSCGGRIAPGATVVMQFRIRGPASDIEERIRGEEVPLAPWYHCERCADLAASLDALGYCVNPADDMRGLVAEYAAIKQHEQWEAADRRLRKVDAAMFGCLDASAASRPAPADCLPIKQWCGHCWSKRCAIGMTPSKQGGDHADA